MALGQWPREDRYKYYFSKPLIFATDPALYSGTTISEGFVGLGYNSETSSLTLTNESGSTVNLVTTPITGSTSYDLQGVTDNGNTTTNFIELNGGLSGGTTIPISGDSIKYNFTSSDITLTKRFDVNLPFPINYNTDIKLFNDGTISGSTIGLRTFGSLGGGSFAKLQTYPLTTDRYFQFPNKSGILALTNDLDLQTVTSGTGNTTNNNINLTGSSISYRTGPTQADIDNETLGTSFGHIFGGGTTGFIQMLGNGNNGGNPNVFVGMNTNGSASAQMTFTSVSGTTSYGGWGGTKNLFRFKNGYVSGNDTLLDIGTDSTRFYKPVILNNGINITGDVNINDIDTFLGQGMLIDKTNKIIKISNSDFLPGVSWNSQLIFRDYISIISNGDVNNSNELLLSTSGLTSGRTINYPDSNGTLPTISNFTTGPATASSPGKQGEIRYDGSFLYICVATDTWMRTSIATW